MRRFILGLLALLLLFPALAVQAQALSPSLFISYIDTSQFPETTVLVAARNFGQPLTDLAVSLYEDNNEVLITNQSSQEIGVQVVILVDASGSINLAGASGKSRIDEVRESVQSLIDSGVLKPETDWLTAYVPRQREIIILHDWTRDHQAVANELIAYQPPPEGTSTPLFNLLFFALDHFSASTEIPPYLNKAIIVYSDGLSGGSSLDLNDAVNHAIAMNIPIHTVLLGNNQQGRNNLERLAILTGGRFVQYDSPNATSNLWRVLERDRIQYIYTYRSQSPAPRELRIEARLADGTTVKAVKPFPPLNTAPVRIQIVNPGPGLLISKVAQTHDQPLEEIEPKELEIEVAFTWPNNQPRALRRVEYIIDGHTEVRTEEPFNRIVFPITDLDSGVHTLRVVAVDELGLIGESEPLTFEIDVYRPDPPPPSVTLTIANRQILIRHDMLNLAANASAILLGIMAVFIALRNPERRARVTRTLTSIGQAVTKTLGIRSSQQVRAYLLIKNRGKGTIPLDGQIPITKEEVKLGRDPQNADILFDDPRISRRHALLRRQQDGTFYIFDDGGRTGTFVNGQRLTTGSQGRQLRSGDLIQLGPVEFRFYYASDFQNLSQEASQSSDDTFPRDERFHSYGEADPDETQRMQY